MNNLERAAEVILPWIEREYGNPEDNADGAVQALADAGLLIPDLPEPSEEIIWYEDSFEVWASEHHGTIEISGTGQPQIHVPIDRAEHLALCIIAAVKESEKPNG